MEQSLILSDLLKRINKGILDKEKYLANHFYKDLAIKEIKEYEKMKEDLITLVLANKECYKGQVYDLEDEELSNFYYPERKFLVEMVFNQGLYFYRAVDLESGLISYFDGYFNWCSLIVIKDKILQSEIRVPKIEKVEKLRR